MSDRPPHPAGLLSTMVRGALTSPFKPAVSADAPLPAGRLTLPGSRIHPGRLAAYAQICGFDRTGPLPLTYPHVLGFPAAMRLMTARAFPLPVLGLVHTGIEITRHRALPADHAPELSVYADGLRPHRRGTEVVMVTEARLAGELVWESRSRYLARHRTSEAHPEVRTDDARSQRTDDAQPHRTDDDATVDTAATTGTATGTSIGTATATATWELPAGLGRRYGAASGDRNPIHLSPLTARLFGFPRAIAHGMWTAARCLAEAGTPDAVRVRIGFRAPVLLPGTVTYTADPGAGTFRLLSRGREGAERIHLTGEVTAPSAPRS
ncbi:MaoC family dehydratase [Streptomyces sp. NBC_01766]|uniref:MaoC family dehydratase n=1 Tax=Streptomyces sp. NBC_01766 TaxID=2975936 RepID=UPI002DDBC935|nr:MaoC/PaaZ C-terminal domain-containing protein [Streptomyces sp. NBC_01766]WSC20620.1 MaoC/PaaZ C-terminal domain-containing protein [Streptomyces sp. NBC_01766]